MIGYHHAIIAIAGMFGFLVGSVVVDGDHSGSWSCKWRGFWGDDKGEMECNRGVLHNPILMLSMAAFSLCLGVGLLFHYIMDHVRPIG